MQKNCVQARLEVALEREEGGRSGAVVRLADAPWTARAIVVTISRHPKILTLLVSQKSTSKSGVRERGERARSVPLDGREVLESVGTTCQVSGSVTVSRYTLQEQTHGRQRDRKSEDATNPSDHSRTITLRQRFSVGFG